MNILKIICALFLNISLLQAKDASNLKIPNIPVALKNDTETLDAFKQLLLKYYDRIHKSEYYNKLSDELQKKALEYQQNSQKMKKEAEDLLHFIVQKVGEHKELQSKYQKKNLMAIKNASIPEAQNRNVEHFVQNLAAQLK